MDDHERLEAFVQSDLLRLTSNLLRIVRGAGKPEQLYSDMLTCLKSHQAYKKSVGHAVPAEIIANTLEFRSDDTSQQEMEFRMRQYADETIVRGALQFAASTLAGQSTQLAAGSREMSEGIRDRQEAMENIRKRYR